MADKIRVLYFLEDIAQEGFITALVKRVARDELGTLGNLEHDIRSARGGSKVTTEFRKFARDTERSAMPETTFLVSVQAILAKQPAVFINDGLGIPSK